MSDFRRLRIRTCFSVRAYVCSQPLYLLLAFVPAHSFHPYNSRLSWCIYRQFPYCLSPLIKFKWTGRALQSLFIRAVNTVAVTVPVVVQTPFLHVGDQSCRQDPRWAPVAALYSDGNTLSLTPLATLVPAWDKASLTLFKDRAVQAAPRASFSLNWLLFILTLCFILILLF